MTEKKPTLFQAITPIVILMVLITINVLVVPDDSISGANQLSLLIATLITIGISLYNGVKWDKISDSMIATVSSATSSILILLVIGLLSGSWMLSGVVPTMIFYGLKIINPSFFLPATVIISAIISVVVGSSWSTVATVGVALLGIGRALGFDDSIIAGAIISGAYFGDKISPLSDTTNLAAAITKVPIFTHIRYMMQTTVPSFIITLILFVIITFFFSDIQGVTGESEIERVIAQNYNVSPFLLLVPIAVVWMIAKKYPTFIVLILGGLIGAVVALFAQPEAIQSIAGVTNMTATDTYKVITKAMYGSIDVNTGVESVDSLLSTGGMAGMLSTIWLIIMAMIFGGALDAGRLLEKIISTVESKITSTGAAVTTTALSSIFFNISSADQYMAIVVPGKMFSPLFERLRLQPKLLSRTLEDSATVTSVLIPWNTCGATQAAVLGVATAAYAPYAFFCYISPLMTMLFAWLKIKIKPLEEQKDGEDKKVD